MKSEKKTAAMVTERREKDKVKQAKKKATTIAADMQKKDKSRKVIEKKSAKAAVSEPSKKKEKAVVPTTQDSDDDDDVDVDVDAAESSNAITRSSSANSDKTGVVYLGGLVHGFYEHQIRSYFEQFGEIKRLRISRNKRTGASRHHGFVQFAEPSTAEIVAKATDGYLIMGNILRCRVMAPEAVHDDIWKGAGRRFKAVPWATMAGRRLERAATESVWERRIKKEERRRGARAEKLKELLGYEFEGPELKAAEAKEVPAVEGEAAPEAIEAASED